MAFFRGARDSILVFMAHLKMVPKSPSMGTFAEQEKPTVSDLKSVDRPTRNEMREILENHVSWLDSAGEAGARADFSEKNLEIAELVDARLSGALLNKAILEGADLTLADFRDASLVQADLEGATLLATQFQQANLQAADLRGANGLLSPQLAGTNLFSATLPESISPLEGLKLVRQTARNGGWLLGATLILDGLAALRVLTTPDAHLVRNSSALPFASLQTALPYVPFYLFGPVVILSLYVCFHLYMQRLWDGIAQMPAIFPDGQRLDASLPWFARWSARTHFHWLRKSQSPLAFLEAAIAKVFLYWFAPATVLLFWARYMRLEDLRGTTLHIFLAVGAVVAAMNFPRMAGKAFETNAPGRGNERKSLYGLAREFHNSVPPAIGLLLFLLSIGTYLGVPHDYRGAQVTSAGIFRPMAPDLLWTVGFNPFAQLTEAEVSSKPSNWTGSEEQIAQVKGANLNGLRLRYIQAYGAFLVKAHLWRTDLRSAYLSEADLREANLRQADLQFAVLDGAKLQRAALPEANLCNANLDRANLSEANLSFAVLSGATLLDATLDGANLYKSDLRAAQLQRANLKKADLREAVLENSNLTMANLGESYLISTKLSGARLKNADLSRAILTDAVLRNSDLSGALLQGAVLRGADIGGANLQGADLRGAEGLTATQGCSAASLRGALMDDALGQNVTALCPSVR
jgi:uncharacterized protein YjbI with pentapeptide repeats